MTLAADRNTPERGGDIRSIPMGAQLIYAGALVMLNASGFAIKGATATGSVGLGMATERVDNSGGSNGDKSIKVKSGIYRFKNSTSGDAIAVDDIGKACFIVDDEQVALTDGSAARSIAGFVHDVDSQGVWVRFDEALARAYLAGITLPEGA